MLFLLLINLSICLLSSENHLLGKGEVDIFKHNFSPPNHMKGLSSEKEWVRFLNSWFRVVAQGERQSGDSKSGGRGERVRVRTLWATVVHELEESGLLKQRGLPWWCSG